MSRLFRPLSFLRLRLLTIFRDEPSWAEFFSATAIFAFVVPSIISGKSPEAWSSMALLTDLLPGWWWVVIMALGASVQMTGLIFNSRFIRASAAFGAILLIVVLTMMVWPVFPFSPILCMASAAVGLPNLFVVARHARDW